MHLNICNRGSIFLAWNVCRDASKLPWMAYDLIWDTTVRPFCNALSAISLFHLITPKQKLGPNIGICRSPKSINIILWNFYCVARYTDPMFLRGPFLSSFSLHKRYEAKFYFFRILLIISKRVNIFSWNLNQSNFNYSSTQIQNFIKIGLLVWSQ